MSPYEEQRLKNIEKNKALLQALQLDRPFFDSKEKPRAPRPKTPSKKRRAVANDADLEPALKVPRLNSEPILEIGVRRSQRHIGKTINYTAEQSQGLPVPISARNGVKLSGNEGPLGKEGGKRVHNPKQFGSIPGIEVGTWWETREGCSVDAIHAPWVGGISGGPKGAYSVALSGGYDDDVDLGYGFTYTGSGGRDLKGTKAAPKNLRTAPQSSDQNFENSFNKALKMSSETKKPVRVIRGYKLKSIYAPSEGYRYDGLYTIERAWIEPGLNPKGYKVCKFAFKRIAGQPPLSVREDIDSAQDDVDREP